MLLCIGAIAIKCCSVPRTVAKRSGLSATVSMASTDRCIFIVSMKNTEVETPTCNRSV
uniref:Uncharacterized protein n=1 Tax=Siphoviridae sp. ctXX925 TaxID=2826370 RepID=A0A8S5R269_9CAUD|nr:MAG TPA: hypothetical protein [Siphoviridae sp. ctXX925]